MSKELHLRTSFNRQARLYHEIRPRYPEELFEALVKVTDLQPEAHLLEIGPGTGQATEALARRGYNITAVELGADLARVARAALQKYPHVEVVTGAFEDVQLPTEAFDLVYAATAFHWLSPAAQFSKPYSLLKQIGHLAVIDTHHVSDEMGDPFFSASQPVYEKYKLSDKGTEFRLPRTSDIQPFRLDDNLFEFIFFKAYPLVVRYTGEQYAKLLSTYSPVLAVQPETRAGFLKEISELIEKQFGNSLLKNFAMSLTLAKKKS